MGLFSAIGGLLGLNSNRKSIQNAANDANAGLQKGINTNTAQQAANSTLFSPYETQGSSAVNSLASMLGLGNPGGAGAALDNFRNSNVFDTLNNVGANTVLQNASATGGLRSGNTDTALYNESTGLLNNLYQQQIGNLTNLSGLGLGAAGTNASLNTGLSNNIAQMLGLQGQNQANATLGKTQASNAAFKGLTDWLEASPSSGTTNGSILSNQASRAGSNIFNALASLF